MKEVAWYVLGFAAAVSAVAFALLLAPDPADAAEGHGGLLQHLTGAEWSDLVITLIFGLIAFVAGSYLSSQAARTAETGETAPADALPVELVAAESAG